MNEVVEEVARAIAANECASDWFDVCCENQANCHCRINARASISALLDAIAEPSEAQLAAANALPITKQVDGFIAMTAMRYGGRGDMGIPGAPDTPIQQWYRAMIAALRHSVNHNE